MPQPARSAGISVFCSHVPFAYRKKSSPGLTFWSMPATSTPCGAAAVVDWAGVQAAHTAAVSVSATAAGIRCNRIGQSYAKRLALSIRGYATTDEPAHQQPQKSAVW